MQRKIGGRFLMLPYEVLDILFELPERALIIYAKLIKEFLVIEDWEAEGDWIQGTIKANKKEIATKLQISRAQFYDKDDHNSWQELIEKGLIKEDCDGEYIIIMLRKKIDQSVSSANVKNLENRIAELEKIMKSLQGGPEGGQGNQVSEVEIEENSFSQNDKKNDLHTAGQKSLLISSCRSQVISSCGSQVISKKGSAEPIYTRARSDLDHIDNIIYEDEEKKINKCENLISQKKKFVRNQIANLWPGRGHKPLEDDEIIEQLVNFSEDKITEAFSAARRSRIKAGRYNWILNRLEFPEEYVKKQTSGFSGGNGKKKRAEEKKKKMSDTGELGTDDNFLGLQADWLKEN